MINWPENRAVKKNAFVLLPTDVGTMIVNRFDYNTSPSGERYGVSHHLLEASSFDSDEINLMMKILVAIRQSRGNGVVMIDGGANLGVHSLAAGRAMQGWGSVIAFEAQERLFYALAGSIALNNLFNVQAKWNALSQTVGVIHIPVPDYLRSSSFGSLEMQYSSASENIGQPITSHQSINAVTIDSLNLPRVDFIKLDVEGMEKQVVLGASETITKFRPILHVEHFKCNESLINLIKSFDYSIQTLGPNSLCIPNGVEFQGMIK